MGITKPISKRQIQILSFLVYYITKNGYAPTIREIGSHVGLSSPASVKSQLDNLKWQGYIDFERNKPRTIKLFMGELKWKE